MLLKSELDLSIGTVHLKTDFRNGVQWWVYCDSGAVLDMEQLLFSLFLGIEPTKNQADTSALIKWVCGREMPPAPSGVSERLFKIQDDYTYLWAQVKKTYGIDLNIVEGLHWHSFLAIFDDIVGGIDLAQIIKIRGYKPEKGDSKEYQASMRKLYEGYAIPGENSSLIEREIARNEAVIEAVIARHKEIK